MGCHTWLYAKTKEQPTYEEIKQNVISSHLRELDWFDKYLKNELPQEDKWLFQDDTFEGVIYKKRVYERRLRIIQNDFCKVAVCHYYNSIFYNEDRFRRSYELIVSEDNQSFVQYVDLAGSNLAPKEEWYHDTFRIFGYPEDILYSFEETISFLRKNGSKIQYGNNRCLNPKEHYKDRKWVEQSRRLSKKKCIKRLREFWDKHPEGMIKFG